MSTIMSANSTWWKRVLDAKNSMQDVHQYVNYNGCICSYTIIWSGRYRIKVCLQLDETFEKFFFLTHCAGCITDCEREKRIHFLINTDILWLKKQKKKKDENESEP